MTFLGPDPLQEQIEHILSLLRKGEPPRDIEVTQVDVKEEPGRRKNGKVLAGETENEEAAQFLAGEMACMANTPGGGAVILGIDDTGIRIGTSLEPGWLRHRIWEVTGRKLTVTVREAELAGTRLLVLSTPQSLEPISYQGRLRWRVGDNCVEIDPTSWHTEVQRRTGFDWSAQPSGHTLDDIAPLAVEMARFFLEDDGKTDLANATRNDLLRRLGLVDGGGRLTNAGSLLFVETPNEGLDYIRRQVSGGDSTHRVRGGTRPLVVQFYEVEKAGEIANRLIHIPRGFVHRQIRAIPSRAFREAIVNGVTHRDWFSPDRTFVEHVGDRLSVTSPGGFLPGITPENIITHPPQPRHRSLAKAMSRMGLAEDEGIGVDRMVIEMLAVGHPRPGFAEIKGPSVRIMLFGGDPDPVMIDFLSSLNPRELSRDVDLLLVLDHLISHGWLDTGAASSATQRTSLESEEILSRIENVRVGGGELIVPVSGAPTEPSKAYRLGKAAQRRLEYRLETFRNIHGRESLILNWAKSRGRVSSTEVSDLTGVSKPYAGKLLTELADRGLLVGSRPHKMGRGYHYLSAAEESTSPPD